MMEAGNSSSVNTTSVLLCPLTVWNIIVLAMGTADFALSLPLVLWALWVLLSTSRTVLETELFILNVLLADITCIMIYCFSYFNYVVFFNLFEKYIFGLYCTFLNGYPLFQFSVCFEQYMAVVHPFTFLKYKPLRYKAVCLFFMWLVALASAVFDTTVLKDLHILLSVIIPVVCSQTYFSLSILRVLKRKPPGDRARNNTIKKRALIVVCILQMKLLSNYLPFIMFTSFKGLFNTLFYDCYIFQLALSICLFGHFIHPVLYLQKSGRLPIPQAVLN